MMPSGHAGQGRREQGARLRRPVRVRAGLGGRQRAVAREDGAEGLRFCQEQLIG